MSEILCAGVGSLTKACPLLSRIEMHAEARDFEGKWFEEVIVAAAAADPSGYNTRQTAKNIDDIKNSNAIASFLLDMQDMASTAVSRHPARIWREDISQEVLLATRWYAEIQQLSGLREATLMLTQRGWFWIGHSTAEETTFSLNLWKIRWVFLKLATRPKSGRIDLLFPLGNDSVFEQRSMEEVDVEERGTGEVTARR